MKKYLTILTSMMVVGAGLAGATVTLNTFFGVAYSSDGSTAVPDGTLWVMIVDDGDASLPGGLEVNTSLTAGEDESNIVADFEGVTISLGNQINGDSIFAFGGMNGDANYFTPGTDGRALELTVGENGVTSGRAFGFYWFPGIEYTGGNPLLSDVLEVGGISDITGVDSLSGFDPMEIPSDGSTTAPSAGTADVGGTFSAARFTAVAIPEPSALTLSGLAALALLRRRRA